MPNLSHFLALLAVPCCPGYTWTNLALPVLNESLDRSVQWFIRKFPAMHRFDPKASTEQESDSYLKCRLETAAIGLQLQIVFSILFDPLSRAGISHVSQDLSTVPGVAAMLDSHSGFGPDIEHQRVQRQLRQLGKVSDWHRMLEWFRLEWVSKDVLLQWLVQAQRRSLARKYHSAGMAATVLQKGDVFSIRPCMEQLQLTLGWVCAPPRLLASVCCPRFGLLCLACSRVVVLCLLVSLLVSLLVYLLCCLLCCLLF
jgi:hypothetical protein